MSYRYVSVQPLPRATKDREVEGGGVQPDLHLHACMRLFSLCPIDNSLWVVCKISSAAAHTWGQPATAGQAVCQMCSSSGCWGEYKPSTSTELYKVKISFLTTYISIILWTLPDSFGCFLPFRNTFIWFIWVSFYFVGNLNAPLSYTLKLSSLHFWCWRRLTLFKASIDNVASLRAVLSLIHIHLYYLQWRVEVMTLLVHTVKIIILRIVLRRSGSISKNDTDDRINVLMHLHDWAKMDK